MSKDSLAYASRRVGRLNGLTHIMFHRNSMCIHISYFPVIYLFSFSVYYCPVYPFTSAGLELSVWLIVGSTNGDESFNVCSQQNMQQDINIKSHRDSVSVYVCSTDKHSQCIWCNSHGNRSPK